MSKDELLLKIQFEKWELSNLDSREWECFKAGYELAREKYETFSEEELEAIKSKWHDR